MKILRKQAINQFFSGAASVLSIMPTKRDIKTITSPIFSDYDAIHNDWSKIGGDLIVAFQKSKRVNNVKNS
jgi:hypothetical protein